MRNTILSSASAVVLALVPLVSVGAVLATASPAVAAEPFDGPYAGVSAGWNRDEIGRDLGGGLTLDRQTRRDAFSLGAFAGYNFRLAPRVVAGPEVGVSATTDDALSGTVPGAGLAIDPRYAFDLSLRAGYLVTDRTLVYLRGGYTNLRARITTNTPTERIRISDNLDGWQLGGGVEQAITDRISARLEYRYSDLGQNGGSYDRDQTLIGVSYNF